MNICQKFIQENRIEIVNRELRYLNKDISCLLYIEVIHNYTYNMKFKKKLFLFKIMNYY